MKQKRTLSPQEARDFLGISRSTLQKFRDNGSLVRGIHYHAIPHGRSGEQYRYIREALEEWVTQNHVTIEVKGEVQ
jgi:hypothetical protein